MITFILEKHGYEVLPARNGCDAIELAIQAKPALILLDIQLPDIDGHTVARTLRENHLLADTPIVAVTADAMADYHERATRTLFSGYIEKPISPDTFLKDIAHYFNPPS